VFGIFHSFFKKGLVDVEPIELSPLGKIWGQEGRLQLTMQISSHQGLLNLCKNGLENQATWLNQERLIILNGG